jgi:hypothetical protein
MFACNGGWGGSSHGSSGAPTIILQPANQTITKGQSATFTVTATGNGPFTYQWYNNGTAISGATSSSYTTPTTATNGTIFTVTVSNAAGTVTSGSATLAVNTSPVASSLLCNPSTPAYNASVTLVPSFSGGAGVIGSSGVGSSDITAQAVSGSSYVSPALTSAETYTLTVTGPGKPAASAICSVTPSSVSISNISPANQSIAPGQQNFSATAIGGATDGLTWTASAGSFSGSVWTAPTAAGTYTITATSVDEPSVSVSTTVVVSLPVITTQPVSQNICTGTVILSVAADYADSYQWNLNGSPISGATSSTYSIPSATPADDGSYSVTITNPAGAVTSVAAKVVVGSSITSNPKSLSIYTTQTATFSVSAQGQSLLSYQWYVIPAGSSTGTVISGATSDTYTTAAVDISYDGAQYYVTVADACGGSTLTSTKALLTVVAGNVSPTITTEPTGQTVAVDGTTIFSVVASGTPSLSYQWYRIPAGSVTGTAVTGATAASYTVPDTETATSNNQDAYYVIVTNAYGQAVSQSATLAVGDGIQITGQPVSAYVNDGASASFTVTATSNLPLSYQWYEASPGSSTFTAISGATSATYTLDSAASSDTGSVFYVVVSNGIPSSVTSSSAALFVGPLAGIDDLCSASWSAIGSATALSSGCGFQLTSANYDQHGELVWPILIATSNIQLSFTVAVSNPSALPADGFAMVLGDPSLGAKTTSTGAVGLGLGAEGIPGFVLGFDTYHNAGEPPVPYIGVGRGETSMWEKPWFDVNTSIPAIATVGATVSHDYTVSIVQGELSVTMDGTQVLSGTVAVPPVAYLYVTASTGGSYEQTVISNLTAAVSAP